MTALPVFQIIGFYFGSVATLFTHIYVGGIVGVRAAYRLMPNLIITILTIIAKRITPPSRRRINGRRLCLQPMDCMQHVSAVRSLLCVCALVPLCCYAAVLMCQYSFRPVLLLLCYYATMLLCYHAIIMSVLML